ITGRLPALICGVQMLSRRQSSDCVYWFCWQTPLLDRRPRAYHNAELPFVFNNVEHCRSATGASEEAIRLGEIITDAWIAFARSGNPSHDGLPEWHPVTPDGAETMV